MRSFNILLENIVSLLIIGIPILSGIAGGMGSGTSMAIAGAIIGFGITILTLSVISPLLEIAANTRGLKGISFTDLSTRPTHQSAYSHSDHNLDVDANTPDFGWKSCKKCKSHMLIEPKNGKCPICNTLVHENSSSESTVVI